MLLSIEYQNSHIHYSVQGIGPPIIFLHGWPTHSGLWKSQVEALKTDYRTIAFDWPGFGQSDKPANHRYTFTKSKEILDTVLSDLLSKQEKATLVAHDIGGPPAILWASEHEERVEKLILLNTILYPFKTPTDALSELLLHIPLLKDVFVSPFGLWRVLKTMTTSRNKAIDSALEGFLSTYRNVPPTIIRKTLLEPLREGRKKELRILSKKFKDLGVEKHLVIGKKDPLCYKHIRQLSLENPEVPAHYLNGCGHLIPIDQPHALNNILLRILNKNKGGVKRP